MEPLAGPREVWMAGGKVPVPGLRAGVPRLRTLCRDRLGMQHLPSGELGAAARTVWRMLEEWVESTKQLHSHGWSWSLWARWLLFGVVTVGMAWAWGSGRLASIDLEGLRTMVHSAGTWGPVVYVLAFGMLQPVGVSAHLFLVAAGLVWSLPEALLWTQLGLNLGSLVSYGFGRALAPEALRARIPAGVLAWEERLKGGGLRTVIVVRIVFFSFFPLSALMGAMRIPFRNYALGTFLGCLPVAVGEVMLAHRLAGWYGG